VEVHRSDFAVYIVIRFVVLAHDVMPKIQEQGIKAKALQAAATTDDRTVKSCFEISRALFP
jgi:hypothetical protein